MDGDDYDDDDDDDVYLRENVYLICGQWTLARCAVRAWYGEARMRRMSGAQFWFMNYLKRLGRLWNCWWSKGMHMAHTSLIHQRYFNIMSGLLPFFKSKYLFDRF